MTSKHSYFHELEIKQLFTDEIERIFALDEVVDDLDCDGCVRQGVVGPPHRCECAAANVALEHKGADFEPWAQIVGHRCL